MKIKSKNPKRVLIVLLSMLIIFSCMPVSVMSASATDTAPNAAPDITVTIDNGESVTLKDADSDSYYEIGTADELYAFAYAVNGGNTSINAKLTENIVVNSVINYWFPTYERVWVPIGNENNPYKGNFDGNGNTISGLFFCDYESNYIALFGYSSGVIKNTGVINSYFGGNHCIAGITGYNTGVVMNCYNSSEMRSIYGTIGGIAGHNIGSIINCYNTSLISNAYSPSAGIAGSCQGGTISHCYNTGRIDSPDGYASGIVGISYDGDATITNCYNTGEILAYTAGGILGAYLGGIIKNCYNIGDMNHSFM
ncbi:MAG: hypothetical protein U0O22_04495 [Acutalibacteraceae bacterium]